MSILKKGQILIIDEIENSLHTLLQRYILEIFNSRNKNSKNAQLIFTTHNIDLLQEKLLQPEQIYFTEKNRKTLQSKLFSLATFNDIKKNKKLEFYEEYLIDRYGAIPNIIDTEI